MTSIQVDCCRQRIDDRQRTNVFVLRVLALLLCVRLEQLPGTEQLQRHLVASQSGVRFGEEDRAPLPVLRKIQTPLRFPIKQLPILSHRWLRVRPNRKNKRQHITGKLLSRLQPVSGFVSEQKARAALTPTGNNRAFIRVCDWPRANSGAFPSSSTSASFWPRTTCCST